MPLEGSVVGLIAIGWEGGSVGPHNCVQLRLPQYSAAVPNAFHESRAFAIPRATTESDGVVYDGFTIAVKAGELTKDDGGDVKLLAGVAVFILVSVGAPNFALSSKGIDADAELPARTRIDNRSPFDVSPASANEPRVSSESPLVAQNAFPGVGAQKRDAADSTPEPLSIVLLGTVLLGCTALLRRQRTRD